MQTENTKSYKRASYTITNEKLFSKRKKIPQDIKEKWLKALRSGEYKKGRLYLKEANQEGDIRYCCLGVLCEVMKIPNRRITFSPLFSFSFDAHYGTKSLPLSVADSINITPNGLFPEGVNVLINNGPLCLPSLASVNDNLDIDSFDEIAWLIEELF